MLQLSDEALLLWCRRLLASRLTSMNWSCLRQVQQFLLTLELDGLLPEGVRISDSLTRALAGGLAPLGQGGRGRSGTGLGSTKIKLYRAASGTAD